MITYFTEPSSPQWGIFRPSRNTNPVVSICAEERIEFTFNDGDGHVDVSIKDPLLTEQRAKDILEQITGSPVEVRMLKVFQLI